MSMNNFPTSSCCVSYCVTEVLYWQLRIAGRGDGDTIMQSYHDENILGYQDVKMPGCKDAWIPR